MERGTQVAQVVKPYHGGNNEAWAAVLLYGTVQCSTTVVVQYGTVRYSTVQYSTVQYSTVRYGTVQHGTVRYGTVQYSSSAVVYGT